MKRIILIITAIVAVIFIMFYFIAIPRLINIEKHRPQIEKGVEERIDLPVTLGRMDTSLTWNLGIRVYFNRIDLKHSEGREYISAGPSFIEISLPALLKNNVLIRKIEIERLVLYVTRLENGAFDVEQLVPKPEVPQKYKVLFRNTAIILKDYRLYFKDKYVNPDQNYVLYGQKLKILDLDPDKNIRVAAKGNILTGGGRPDTLYDLDFSTALPFNTQKLLDNKMTLKGEVKNLYPQIFLVYLNQFIPGHYSKISGSIDSNLDINLLQSRFFPDNIHIENVIRNLTAEKPDKGIVLQFPETTRILFQGKELNDNLLINELSINDKKINAVLSGAISNYTSENPDLNLSFSMSKTSIGSLIRMIPEELNIRNLSMNNLKKYNIEGNLWSDLSIKGFPDALNLRGDLRFNNLSLYGNLVKIPKSSGKIEFLEKKIDINSRIFVDPNGYINAAGSIIPDQKKMNLSVISNVISLKEAKLLLLIIGDLLNLNTDPLANIDISGQGRVNLKLLNNINNPDIKGYLNINQANVYYQGISKPVNNMNGVIKFNNNRIIVDNLKGFIDRSKIVVNGNSTLKGLINLNISAPALNLATVHELIFASPLLADVQRNLKDIRRITGFVNVAVSLSGNVQNIASRGDVAIHGANIVYNGISQPLRSLRGQISFANSSLYMNNLRGVIAQSPLAANGKIVSNKIDMVIASQKLDLSSLRKLIVNSPVLTDIEKAVDDITGLSGFAKARLRLVGNLKSDNIFEQISMIIYNASLKHRQLSFPVNRINGPLFINKQGIYIKDLRAEALGAPMKIAGRITGLGANLSPKLNILVQKFPLNQVRQLVKSPVITSETRQIAAEFRSLRGYLNASIAVVPDSYKANLNFSNAYAFYTPQNLPLRLNTGSITISPATLILSSLNGRISRSPVYANGSVKNYQATPWFNLSVSSSLNSKDIEKYVNPYLDEPITARGNFPTAAYIKGNIDNWNLLAQTLINKGDNLYYKDDLGLPETQTRILNLKANGNSNRLVVNNFEIATQPKPIDIKLAELPQQSITANAKQVLNVKGTLRRIGDEPTFDNFVVSIPNPLSVKILNPIIAAETDMEEPFFTNGRVTGQAVINGDISSPVVTGNFVLADVTVPSRDTIVNSAFIDLTTDKILVQQSSITIADSKMTATAVAEKQFKLPLIINRADIIAETFSVDDIVDSFRKTPTGEGIPGEAEPYPIVVQDGTLKANELIISNLITQNYSSRFNLSPDSILTVTDIAFGTAGGRGAGEFSYDLLTTTLDGSFTAEGLKANAIATTFLNLPNEIFGNLKGSVNLSTSGTTSEELIGNADGEASFEIDDGRLVRLGSIEYLLLAANTAMSGVAGLNLNSILNLVIPQRTGYFQTLTGNLTAREGTLYTDNVTSKGKNLSLLIKGSLNMLTDYADITVLGRISKRVTGLLGPLGSLSINEFIGFVPGIGFLPGVDVGLIDIIPFINRIPLLGLGGSRRYRRFAVDIIGDLYDPKSVKTFRWID